MLLDYRSTKKPDHIRDVAIYMRKSRGDEGDLAKHRMILEDLCKSKGWRYSKYSEIGTSDSIDLRPQMIQLLKDIENELYDAVVVVDLDRLSRGDGEEQARIKNILRLTNTLIVTPYKTYDLNDDNDDMFSDFEGLMARVEYKQIKKRFRRGKKQGSRRGDWTNGTPPYPYEYQKWHDEKTGKIYQNEKGLVVNREKMEIYQTMKNWILLDNLSPNQIAWELNKRGLPSPKGGSWHGNTIQRIMMDETHLGKIISNKTSGDWHKIKRNKDCKGVVIHPKSEWIIVENCHEALKTELEHEQLRLFFSRMTKTPKRRGSNVYPLSGLIKCAKCGRTMVVGYKNYKNRKAEQIKRCWHTDSIGNKCQNRGSDASIVHEKIMRELAKYEAELKSSLEGDNREELQTLRDMEITLTEITKTEKKMCRIDELVEEEYYTSQEAKARKQYLKIKLDEAERRLNLIQIRIDSTKKVTNQERLHIIEQFKSDVSKGDLTAEEINNLYKRIISQIVWERDEDAIKIDINFL